MKKSLIAICLFTLLFNLNCSKTPDGDIANQSIESVEGDKVLIRLKPRVGDTQKTIMTMDMSADGTQSMKMNMVMNMDMKVTDKQDNLYTYEVKYNSIKMNMNAGGMEMSYDSNAKEQSGMGAIMHDQMKALLNKPISMKMSDQGKISDFSLPGMANNQQMGDMSSISIPLPEKPVGVGDSWAAERPLEGMGNMKMNMKVDKITVDDLIIETSGDISDTSGTKIGNFDGNYKLDRSTGFTKDGTINMDLPVQGQQMKMKINFKSL